MPNYWVYILFCGNGNYYTGYARDLIQRYQLHLSGSAAKYTRSFPPLYLAQSWPIFGDKGLAMKIENFMKKMNKKTKENLVDNPEHFEELVIKSIE